MNESNKQDKNISRGRSQRRLALALLLVMMLGAIYFFVSDVPAIVEYRQLLLSELGFGGEETVDTETADDGTSDAVVSEEQEQSRSESVSSSGSGGNTAEIDTNALPEFNGSNYVTVNGNMPVFPDDVYIRAGYVRNGTSWNLSSLTPYEFYGKLDNLGRCTVAYGCLGIETMPPDGVERGDISKVHPSGWARAQNWERSHLIAWKLSAENANERNLVTGTHYMNHDGMRPIEEEVEQYIWRTGNHVLYMSKPIFKGDELVPRGVQMTVWSCEDKGKGKSLNVYVFNVTPGAEINYYNGVVTTGEQMTQDARAYVINTRSGVFHYPSCEGVRTMAKKNRKDVTATRKELTDQGYVPCGYCEP